jgi:hypothetical protein
MLPMQERSFKEFAARPENKPLLEQHQQQEVAAALQLQEQEQLATLQQQVNQINQLLLSAALTLKRAVCCDTCKWQCAHKKAVKDRCHQGPDTYGSVCLFPCALQVSELDPADARLLAPVLRSPVLRQLLVSLAKDAAAAAEAAAATPAVGAGTASSGELECTMASSNSA